MKTSKKPAKFINIDSKKIYLTEPDKIDFNWVKQDDVKDQLLAAWLSIIENEIPLNPRLIGSPGIGKTTLACAVARELKLPLYIFQCTSDTRPEDLIITPVIAAGQKIIYQASSLVSAVIAGGICVLDEGNRMKEKSWASLAPLLDRRRYVESIIAGVKIKAHKDFRICTTMNDDTSVYELPGYIQSRLKPKIEIPRPDKEMEIEIIKVNLPYAPLELITKLTIFLEEQHNENNFLSIREMLHIAEYTQKLVIQKKTTYAKAFKLAKKLILD